jgi:hypothetical protein
VEQFHVQLIVLDDEYHLAHTCRFRLRNHRWPRIPLFPRPAARGSRTMPIALFCTDSMGHGEPTVHETRNQVFKQGIVRALMRGSG